MKTNMAETNTKQLLRDFVHQKFPLARTRHLADSDALLETGVLDSLGVLDVVHFVEQTFSVTIADDDLTPENFQSLDTIAQFVESKRTSVR